MNFHSFLSSFILHNSSLRVKRLFQIPLDVFEVFKTNAQADEIGADASGDLLFFAELAVRSGGGVNGETARITDVREVAEELQAFDELPACFCASFDAETENCACALGKILLRARMIGMALESRVFDPANLRVFLKIFGNGLRVLHVTVNAQVEGFES